ncbi:MAG: C-GCAxxG-C-C family protein [Proteobacteria bacterium]|nr:C-GCAxxG-C-C family protein [Pseudomonadota bacterium]
MTLDVGREAAEIFDSGLDCAESVLLALSRRMGIESPWIPRIATGFCGGLARTNGPCGALTGALMALSLWAGRDAAKGSKDACYAAVQALVSRFGREFGSTNCLDLQGHNLSRPEGREAFTRENTREKKCRWFTERAASLAGVILESSR